ncbi:MAG: GntR family transcriptional regulator [Desulfitobacteriaceae bacterium]
MLLTNGPTPYYQQVKEYLRTLIDSGKLGEDEQIPSERELCLQFGISRTTIRQALNESEQEGLIYKVHGKGTFVAPRKIDQELLTMNSFEDTVLSRGLKPKMTVLAVESLQPTLEINAILKLDMVNLTKISLLGHGDDEPIVYYESFIAEQLGKAVAAEAIKRSNQGLSYSTYQLYRDCCGIIPRETHQTIEAAVADSMTAEILQIRKGTPIFLTTSIVYTDNNQPIEYKKVRYRGDKYKFNITRRHI